MFAFSSCEDFLDSENYTGKDSTNFPGTEKDVDQMVAAVYKSTFYAPFEANTHATAAAAIINNFFIFS